MTIKGQTRSHEATQARPHQDYIKAYMCYVMFRFCLGLEFKVEDSSMCCIYEVTEKDWLGSMRAKLVW